jgi:hypothetical protein
MVEAFDATVSDGSSLEREVAAVSACCPLLVGKSVQTVRRPSVGDASRIQR